MALFTLDTKGVLLALVLGIGIYYFAGTNYLILMLVFLFFAAHITRLGYYEKREMGVYEYERGWMNVVSNGIVPFFGALLSQTLGPMPFLGSLSAVMSDKFGSEAGVFDREPVELFTFKKVKPGVSGAVSYLGTIASLAGSIIIALAGFVVFGITANQMLVIALAGFLGSFADSIAGYFEERGFGSKSTSNIVGSMVGFVVALFLGGVI